MFTVACKDRKYDVSFMHYTDSKERRATKCLISKIEPDTIVREPVVEQVAVCSKKDNFNRATGRKQSFSRAVADFDRDMRIQFWNEFWKYNRKI